MGTVRTVPTGYQEPGEEHYPEPVADKDSGEIIGHVWLEPILPETAQETNAKDTSAKDK